MPPKRRATKRKAPTPPVTRGAAKKSTGSDRSSSKTAKATKDAEAAQKKAVDAEAEAAEDARQAAEAARVAEKERRIRKAAKAKSAADRAKKLADDAVKAAEEAAAAAEASDAADDIDPDSTPASSGAEESEEDSPIETTIEDIRSPLAKFGKRRLMRSTSPAAAFQYKRALALIREYDREQDVDSWIQQFHFEADQLSPKDRLAVFRLKVQTKCAGWYNGELLKEPGRPLYRWLKVFGDKFRRTASQRLDTLRQRLQQDGEDASEYVESIIGLCMRHNPNMSEDEQRAHIAANVHPKYSRAFRGMNVHSKTIEMTEESLKEAMALIDGQQKSVRFAGAVQTSPKDEEFRSKEANVLSKPVEGYYSRREKYNRRSPPPVGKKEHESVPMPTIVLNVPSSVKMEPGVSQGMPMFDEAQRSFSNSPGNEQRNCYNCGQKGHLARACRAPRKGNNESRTSNGHRGTSNNSVECTYCHRRNHTADTCFTKMRDDKQRQSAPLTGANSEPVQNSGNGQ